MPNNTSDAPSLNDRLEQATDPLLRTKLFVPQMRPRQVARPRLIERLNKGSDQALILVSAPAGFGKTSALAEWVASGNLPVAWLSLDEGDNDPVRFWTYLIAALQTIEPDIGRPILGALQSGQPPTIESTMTGLLNEIAGMPRDFVIVLDDFHCIEARAVEAAVTYLLEHRPPHMHLVLATREDPRLPLAQLRTQGQLTELRINDLRFGSAEAAEFLNGLMGLDLSAENVDALEARTEGWIAGLQLAAISMQQGHDPTAFIRSFTGSHRFVLDYLVEEVLGRQSEEIQTFLLRTCVLERMCAPLCQALLPADSAPAQETLEYLERANLFIVPLDDERRWYRYHHLFAELLRQRLGQSGVDTAVLHQRASAWHEGEGFDIEAFQHAAAANDIERAAGLLEGRGIPLHQRGALMPALNWLDSLPSAALDARPKLWVLWASAELAGGQTTEVEPKLQRAEAALQSAVPDEETRDLRGQIAAARAMVAVGHYDLETITAQASRALEYLRPGNLSSRFRAHVALANAYEFSGERAALGRAYAEALSIARASGNSLHIGVATIGAGESQEYAIDLHPAAESYRTAVQLLADQPPPILSYAYLGLARILREWNDLAAAEQHLQQGLQLARQYDRDIDVFVICEVELARIRLAQDRVAEAGEVLAEAAKTARQRNFALRLPEITAAQVLALLRGGDLVAAAQLALSFELPMSQARVSLAQGHPAAALSVLAPYRQQIEAKGWIDESLHAIILQAVALRASGARDEASRALCEALALAEPGGFIRLFIDEGTQMAELIADAAAHGVAPDYTRKLLAAFAGEKQGRESRSRVPTAQPLIEPLSERELEVLRLIAHGLSNHEISQRLFLALSTVKGHNRVIFNKLQVQRRTEAVARARELGLL